MKLKKEANKAGFKLNLQKTKIMAPVRSFQGKQWEKQWKQREVPVKAMGFPVVMYGCGSWTIKKAEHQRINVLNCGAGEDSWESLGKQSDQTSPFFFNLI